MLVAPASYSASFVLAVLPSRDKRAFGSAVPPIQTFPPILAPLVGKVRLVESNFISSTPGVYQRKVPALLSISQIVNVLSSKTIRGEPDATPISRRSIPRAVSV